MMDSQVYLSSRRTIHVPTYIKYTWFYLIFVNTLKNYYLCFIDKKHYTSNKLSSLQLTKKTTQLHQTKKNSILKGVMKGNEAMDFFLTVSAFKIFTTDCHVRQCKIKQRTLNMNQRDLCVSFPYLHLTSNVNFRRWLNHSESPFSHGNKNRLFLVWLCTSSFLLL